MLGIRFCVTNFENLLNRTPEGVNRGANLSRSLWADPQLAAPSASFGRYLHARQVFLDNINIAGDTPEPEDGPTAVDVLVDLLNKNAQPVFEQTPTTLSDLAELAVVIRDRFYDVDKNTPHSELDGKEVAKLLAGVICLAAASPQNVKQRTAERQTWPEFTQWLAEIKRREKRSEVFDVARASMTQEQIQAHDEETDQLCNRLFHLEEALLAKPIRSEREFAMAAVVWTYHQDRPAGSTGFDLTSFESATGDLTTQRFVFSAGKRAAELLPEVPFKFPLEG